MRICNATNDAANRLKPQVLIMGAGLIGCEFANDLAHAGYRESVVDPGPRPLANLLPPEASAALQHALENWGVRLYFGATVRAVSTMAGWLAADAGIWQWLDDSGLQRGFVLSCAQTTQRMAQSKLVTL